MIKHLLCPTDFSDGAGSALACALSIAQRFDASIDLLHICEPPAYFAPDLAIWVNPDASTSLVDFALAEASKRMEATVSAHPGLVSCLGARRIEAGLPVRDILRIADEGEYDLLVLGTHGRSGFERLMLGSVAERVIRAARCPVIAVPGTSAA